MQKLILNPKEGIASIEIRCGYLNPGDYLIKLIEKESEEILFISPGVFHKSDTNWFDLQPAMMISGRKLVISLTINIQNPEKMFSASVEIKQGENIKESVSKSGKTEHERHSLIFLREIEVVI